MNPSRETVMTALFNALVAALVNTPTIDAVKFIATAQGALTDQQPLMTVARRVVTYSDSGAKPACYIGEFGNRYNWQSESLGTIRLEPMLFIFTQDGSNQSVVPAISVNNIMDSIDRVLAPDNPNGKCTLGGLVSSVRVNGEVPVDPGDLSGNGVLAVPLEILVANGDLS